MVFRVGETEYRGPSAVKIVLALERDAGEYPHKGSELRRFLAWSLAQLGDSVPIRELDLSSRLDDEMLALSYLCLRDEYGLGDLSGLTDEPTLSDA
jgi:hypothetical protein